MHKLCKLCRFIREAPIVKVVASTTLLLMNVVMKICENEGICNQYNKITNFINSSFTHFVTMTAAVLLY